MDKRLAKMLHQGEKHQHEFPNGGPNCLPLGIKS